MPILALIALLFCAPRLAAEAPAVEVVVLEPVSLPEELRLHGTLEPRREAELALEVGGTVARRAAEVGQRVHAGQVLLQLDPRRYELQVRLRQAERDQARSRLDLAEASLARAEALALDSTLSEEAFDQARYERDAARSLETAATAALELAALDLEQSHLRAPFAGEVADVMVEVGEAVAPGRPVLRLAACDTVEIRAAVSAADLGWLEPGLAVQVAPAAGGAAFAAALTHLSRVADPASRRYPVRVTAPAAGLDPVFGSVADLTVVGRRTRAGVVVPAAAVRSLAGASLAYVVVAVDGAARLQERRVRVARELPGGRLFIVDGLAAGERLAISGAALADGLRVEVGGGLR